jgi:hypothetical protein
VISAHNQRPQALSLAGIAAHHVRVHAQAEPRVGVAELDHDRNGVLTNGDQDRGVCVPEPVGTQPGWQRRLFPPLEQLIGLGQRR